MIKNKKNFARFIIIGILILSFCSMAAIISDNDGLTFVTKSEFDVLKASFSKQIQEYNDSIDGKIDGAIASYLSGVQLSEYISITPLIDKNGKYGSKILRWSSHTTKSRDVESKKYITMNINHYDFMWYAQVDGESPRRLEQLQTATIYWPMPSSGKRTSPSKYNTWRYETKNIDGVNKKVYTPGILTPKVNYWLGFLENKNVTELATWNTNVADHLNVALKRNEGKQYYGGSSWSTQYNYGANIVALDVSLWDTDDGVVSSYTVYPLSTQTEYCFTDDTSYTASSKITNAKGGTSVSSTKSTAASYTCTALHGVDNTTKSSEFSTRLDYYNPSFALTGDKTNELIIQNWLSVSSKNNMVKNGVHLANISVKGVELSFKAKGETAGKLYLYLGTSPIDMVSNLSSCISFDVATTENKFTKIIDIAKNTDIWALFVPTSTSVESYIAINDMQVKTDM